MALPTALGWRPLLHRSRTKSTRSPLGSPSPIDLLNAGRIQWLIGGGGGIAARSMLPHPWGGGFNLQNIYFSLAPGVCVVLRPSYTRQFVARNTLHAMNCLV